MSEKKLYVELPPFTGRNVSISEIAEAMHKDAQYVRIGLQQGIFKFGYAMKVGTLRSTTIIARTERSGKKSAIFARKLSEDRKIDLPVGASKSIKSRSLLTYRD